MRGELAAMETYSHAISKFMGYAPIELTICLQSHDARSTQFAEYIILAGGTPVSGSGFWGAFARIVEGGASLIGPRAILRILEEGEEQGLADYQAAIGKLDDQGQSLIRNTILPEQIRTYGIISGLYRTFK
jgi:hypothetical protein